LDRLRAGALVIGADVFLQVRSGQLGALTLRHALPAISPYREFATTGGLMSYRADISNLWRQVGVYAGRILNGEKPADLPLQQGTRIPLIINMKTVKALGLTVPLSLLATDACPSALGTSRADGLRK
jgi:putative tryptophan/tyrosine transport system substrate-binding protein